MNDNTKRGPQWQKYVGEYFSTRFGGSPSMWAEANRHSVEAIFPKFFDGMTYTQNLISRPIIACILMHG